MFLSSSDEKEDLAGESVIDLFAGGFGVEEEEEDAEEEEERAGILDMVFKAVVDVVDPFEEEELASWEAPLRARDLKVDEEDADEEDDDDEANDFVGLSLEGDDFDDLDNDDVEKDVLTVVFFVPPSTTGRLLEVVRTTGEDDDDGETEERTGFDISAMGMRTTVFSLSILSEG